jgi:hypothetical protein
VHSDIRVFHYIILFLSAYISLTRIATVISRRTDTRLWENTCIRTYPCDPSSYVRGIQQRADTTVKTTATTMNTRMRSTGVYCTECEMQTRVIYLIIDIIWYYCVAYCFLFTRLIITFYLILYATYVFVCVCPRVLCLVCNISYVYIICIW